MLVLNQLDKFDFKLGSVLLFRFLIIVMEQHLKINLGLLLYGLRGADVCPFEP